MTLSGFIATLIALVLAVLAMRLARRGPARRTSMDAPTKRAIPDVRTSADPPPPQGGTEGKPSPATGVGEGAAERSAGRKEMRQSLADTVFKVYSAEDDKKGADAKPVRQSCGKPKPRPAGSDWS